MTGSKSDVGLDGEPKRRKKIHLGLRRQAKRDERRAGKGVVNNFVNNFMKKGIDGGWGKMF
jgi:hypothetical protein